MSSVTIANIPRLSATELSSIILSQSKSSNLSAPAPPSKVAIIDVRDDDHIGGHIRSSLHIPSSTLDHAIPSLVRKLQDKEMVVFHCALSQQRGPSAALRYMRERERLLGEPKIGEVLKKNAEDKVNEGKDGDWEDVKEGGEESAEKRKQKVFILDRGFVGWQETYGSDTRLTEGYRKEIWENGY